MAHSVKSCSSSTTSFIFLFCCHLCLTFSATMASSSEEQSVPESEQIALESSSELLAPEALVNRIQKDLDAIRAKFPAVKDVHHTPKWQPGKLMITDAKKEVLDKITKSSYGPAEAKPIFQDSIWLVTFKKPYNPEKMAELLKKEFGLENVRPDGIFGGSGSITLKGGATGKNTYVWMKGSGDCMSGCINKHFWTFTTEEDKVELVEESGDDPNAGEGGSDRPVGMMMGGF